MQHRVAYTIIAVAPLDPPPHSRAITVAGRRLWELRDGRRDVVVFTRREDHERAMELERPRIRSVSGLEFESQVLGKGVVRTHALEAGRS